MVKAYISQHYDEDLSVEALAEKVYLSPGYLSVIFKKETGQNLNSYIRAYRLAQAKCLLETTNMKIVQVCQKTGFTNVSYFCKRFREHFGTSPHRFRMAENENE
jgi:two-component system response regulator YesN